MQKIKLQLIQEHFPQESGVLMIIKVNYHDLYFEYKKRFWNLPRDLYPYVDGLTIDQNTERRLERYLFDLVRKEIEEMFKVKNEDIEIDSMGRSTYG